MKKEIRDELANIDNRIATGGDDSVQVLSMDWLEQANRCASAKLPLKIASTLAEVDWSSHGQLRGLRMTLKRLLDGCSLDAALAAASAAFSRPCQLQSAETSVDRLRRSLAEGRSLSDAWMNDRYEWAAELLDRLDRGDPEILSTIRIAGCKEGEVKKELRNLMRSGSKTSEN